MIQVHNFIFEISKFYAFTLTTQNLLNKYSPVETRILELPNLIKNWRMKRICKTETCHTKPRHAIQNQTCHTKPRAATE